MCSAFLQQGVWWGAGRCWWLSGCWQQWVTPTLWCSFCSQATALQHGALSQRGHLQGGGWRVPLHLPLPFHRQALRDRYGPLAPTPGGEAAVIPLAAQLLLALCPQVSRTPVPRGPARMGAPASTTLASTSVTVPRATLAGTARSVGVSMAHQCTSAGGVLGLLVELTDAAAASKPSLGACFEAPSL